MRGGEYLGWLREGSFERGLTQEGLIGEVGLNRTLRFCLLNFQPIQF